MANGTNGAEQFEVNYESIDEFSNNLYQKANAYFGRKLIDSELDNKTTIAANKNGKASHEDESKIIALLKTMAGRESVNIKNIGTEFSNLDSDLANYYDEQFSTELKGTVREEE
ncbi:TIGR04197 family type VII secretion effector [Pseudobutyrivibrio sp.]|uniref:TIGR04197 family type VII secretion effector n=1 Tax=Pseudobutyrivibrio sp. TaxID=2014367 RepID=UPI00386FDFDA